MDPEPTAPVGWPRHSPRPPQPVIPTRAFGASAGAAPGLILCLYVQSRNCCGMRINHRQHFVRAVVWSVGPAPRGAGVGGSQTVGRGGWRGRWEPDRLPPLPCVAKVAAWCCQRPGWPLAPPGHPPAVGGCPTRRAAPGRRPPTPGRRLLAQSEALRQRATREVGWRCPVPLRCRPPPAVAFCAWLLRRNRPLDRENPQSPGSRGSGGVRGFFDQAGLKPMSSR